MSESKNGRNYCTLMDELIKLNIEHHNLDMFITLLGKHCLTSLLNNPKRRKTVLVPVDSAFKDLKMSDEEVLKLLKYHIIPKKFTLDELKELDENLRTHAGKGFPISKEPGSTTLKGHKGTVTIKDKGIEAINGVIYIIDKVLIPPKEAQEGGKYMGRNTKFPFEKNGAMLRNYILRDYVRSAPFLQYPGMEQRIDGYGILNNNLEAYFRKRFLNSPFYSYMLATYFDHPVKNNVTKILQPHLKNKKYNISDGLLKDFANTSIYKNRKIRIMTLVKNNSVFHNLIGLGGFPLRNQLLSTYKILYPVDKYPVGKVGDYYSNLLDDIGKYYIANYPKIIRTSFKIRIPIQIQKIHQKIMKTFFLNNLLTPRMKVMSLVLPSDPLFKKFIVDNQLNVKDSPFLVDNNIHHFLKSKYFLFSNFGKQQEKILSITTKKQKGGKLGYSEIFHQSMINKVSKIDQHHWSLLLSYDSLIEKIYLHFRSNWPKKYYSELNNRLQKYFGIKFKTLTDYDDVMTKLFGIPIERDGGLNKPLFDLKLLPVEILRGFTMSPFYPNPTKLNIRLKMDGGRVMQKAMHGDNISNLSSPFEIYKDIEILNNVDANIDMYMKERSKYVAKAKKLFGSALSKAIVDYYLKTAHGDRPYVKLYNDLTNFFHSHLGGNNADWFKFTQAYLIKGDHTSSVNNILHPMAFPDADKIKKIFMDSIYFGQYSERKVGPGDGEVAVSNANVSVTATLAKK